MSLGSLGDDCLSSAYISDWLFSKSQPFSEIILANKPWPMTDRAFRWLHSKPLNAATGRVLAPYRPGGCHGHRHRRSNENTRPQLTFNLACIVLFY